MSLEKDLKKAIADNMPQAVGEELQALLAEGKRNRSRVASLEKQVLGLTEDIERKDKALEQVHTKLRDQEEIALQLQHIKQERHDLDLVLLRAQLDAEQSKCAFAEGLANKAMSAQGFSRTINGTMPMKDDSGYIQDHTFNRTEDVYPQL